MSDPRLISWRKDMTAKFLQANKLAPFPCLPGRRVNIVCDKSCPNRSAASSSASCIVSSMIGAHTVSCPHAIQRLISVSPLSIGHGRLEEREYSCRLEFLWPSSQPADVTVAGNEVY